MARFENVVLKRETTVHLGEHQTLMSFNDDEANYAFQEWWNIKGSELFNEYLKDSISWNHLWNRK